MPTSRRDPPESTRHRVRSAVPPGLRRVLTLVFALVVLLTATGLYQGSITLLEWATGRVHQSVVYFWMVLVHLVAGILLVLPLTLFAILHVRVALRWRNRRALRSGAILLVTASLMTIAGVVLLWRDLGPPWTTLSYWGHVLTPVIGAGLYVLHRRAGRSIAWRRGVATAVTCALLVACMVALHLREPRTGVQLPTSADTARFVPSLVRTTTGGHLSEGLFLMDNYCLECHEDAYSGWFHSAHHFSSFNNPVYRFSLLEFRRRLLERDGDVRASRWCAGCHDPIPLLSGKFDDPAFDDLNEPSARAGVTCTVCHSIVAVNSPRGNADYMIEEPLHYPFARSRHPVLRWINHHLVKAKPGLHRKTFLKPLHRTAEFCSVCHKVHIPEDVNGYKEFLRGQNHYDSYLLSGVSGHGARSFYYPPQASPNCAHDCHMPFIASNDSGARKGRIHDHLFPGANTGIAELRGDEATRRAQADFLGDGNLRLDIFGIKEGGTIDGELRAPVRPTLPTLTPGRDYLIELVLRTLRIGHTFTQGTTDSNQLWIEIRVRSGDRVLGESGTIDERGFVDPWTHFVNQLVLDRHGGRIDRRNVADIFVPLYNHQIPPGAGQVIHYLLRLPGDLPGPVEVHARLLYRKFDRPLLEHVFGEAAAPNLAPVVLCEDRVVLPVAGHEAATRAEAPAAPEWQRWNDYGIGLLLEGKGGAEKGELRQALAAFRQVAALDRAEGWINQARVHLKEGSVDRARDALAHAIDHPGRSVQPWTITWLSGRINHQNGELDDAIRDFEAVLSTRVPSRGFDFSLDYTVRLDLAMALFDRAKRAHGDERRALLERTRDELARVLELDPENLAAHHNLHLAYRLLGNREAADRHRRLHDRYRPDDNATDRAIAAHRAANPAANHAAQSIVIYELRPPR